MPSSITKLQLFHASNTKQSILIACFLMLFISTEVFASNTKSNILVTIKPLYSLVTHLTQGINQPVLLFKNIQTLHHYNMRPSERRLLADADIVIWLGPELEPQLSKIIQTDASKTLSISAMQARNLKLLNKRSKHSHDKNHAHEEHANNGHTTDPHIWLSAHNAAQISRHIADRLISHDPKNTEPYKTNLQRLLTKIEHTKNAIKTTLDKNKKPYIAIHDAFQYYEEEYALNYVASIIYGEGTSTSLKHLRQIKSQIKNQNIRCLVYQPPRPAIVTTLTKKTAIKTAELDPIGVKIDNGKNAWFELMQQISINLSACLSD